MLTRNRRKLCNSNSSPEYAKISKITTKAVVEPLPEYRGKSSTSFKKLNQRKKCVINTQDTFNKIEIINSPDNRPCTTSKRRKINLPRNLTELNGIVELDNVTTTHNCPMKNSVNVVPISTRQINEEEEKNITSKELSNGKEKDNTNKISIRKRIRKVSKRSHTKLHNINSSDTDSAAKDTTEKFQHVTRRKSPVENKYDDFNVLIDSIKNSVSNNCPMASQNIKVSKQKNTLRKRARKKKWDCGDIVMRQCQNDGYESLHSDNELSTLVKKFRPPAIPIKNKKRGVKVTSKPITLNPKSQRKSQSSSSSFLPELEIEVEAVHPPFVPRGFSDSDVPILDIQPEPVKVLSEIHVPSNMCLVEGLETEMSFPVAINKCDAQVLPPKVDNLENSQKLQNTETDFNMFNISTDLPELPNEHSNEAIYSWIATGLPNDSTGVVRRAADCMLCNHANSVKLFLELLKGNVDPSLYDLHNTLIAENSTLDQYLKKKK